MGAMMTTQKNQSKKKTKPRTAKGLRSKNSAITLTPHKPLPHECNEAGRCCWGGVVGLIHTDIFRIISSGVAAEMGFDTTVELTNPDTGIIEYGLDNIHRVPVAFLKLQAYQGHEGAAAHCPFLRWDDDLVGLKERNTLLSGKMPGLGFWKIKGKPRFSCALGSGRPTQCFVYPMARIGESGNNDEPGKWRFLCDISVCRRCAAAPLRKTGCDFTVAEYLKRPDVHVAMAYTRDYIDLNTMLVRREFIEPLRERVGDILYNLDAYLLGEGVTKENLPNVRPSTPDGVMQTAALFVNGIIQEQEKIRKQLWGEVDGADSE
jgi:Fe-S-cluster containining protein